MRTRFVIILLTTVITPSIGFAQNGVDSTNVNKDSLYQNEQKNHSDTTKIDTCLRFPNFHIEQKNQKTVVNLGFLKIPRYDPFKEKVKKLQIANTIRMHISR